MKLLKIFGLLLLAVLSITAIQAQASEDDVIITLERTACFGACPIYTITILEDGTVVYNGEQFVTVTGEQTTEIDLEMVDVMVNAFEDAGYFDWDEAYDTMTISDLPTVTTSVTRDGQTHRIVRYAGDSSAPLALPYLEQWIDVMANTELWTGVHPEIANIGNMNSTIITMERGACYGFCPIDKVALLGDGTGIYMGIANVDKIGVHIFEVEPAIITNLAQLAEIFGYFEWQDSYEEYFMTDQSTIITSVQTVDHFKRIVRYNGDPNAPIGLTWIEDSIIQNVP